MNRYQCYDIRILTSTADINKKNNLGATNLIYTLTIECIDGINKKQNEDCIRIVECDDKDSLYDLHLLIQNVFDFDNDHLYEFFAGRHDRNRKLIFSDHDEFEETQKDYASIPLSKVFPLPPQLKLFYIFDFGDNWVFQIKKSKKISEYLPSIKYPQLIKQIGKDLVQYPPFE